MDSTIHPLDNWYAAVSSLRSLRCNQKDFTDKNNLFVMVTAIFSGRYSDTGDRIFIPPQKEYRGIEQAALRLVWPERFQIFTLLAEVAVICTALVGN